MADKKTKIEPCPNPSCEGLSDCWYVAQGQRHDHRWVECDYCGYRGPSSLTEPAAIAAHNALARPKDVGSYEEQAAKLAFDIDCIVENCRDNVIGHTPSIADYLAAKLSELMAPRDVVGLEEAVRTAAMKINVDPRLVGYETDGTTMVDIVTEHTVAAVRDFCGPGDPETKRQRDALLEVTGRVKELLREKSKRDSGVDDLLFEVENVIADCEATT